jgi:hypothetical protein
VFANVAELEVAELEQSIELDCRQPVAQLQTGVCSTNSQAQIRATLRTPIADARTRAPKR